MHMKSTSVIEIIVLSVFVLTSCITKPNRNLLPSPAVNSLMTTTPVAKSTPTVKAEVTPKTECQPGTSSSTRLDGGLIFYEQDASEFPIITRIWYWSNNMSSPQLIFEKT